MVGAWQGAIRLGGLRFAIAIVCSLVVALSAVFASAARAEPNAVADTFQNRAPSAEPLEAVTVDPTTNLIYAQGYEDTTFYSYDPTTDDWTSLATAPISGGNNGGAAYLAGDVYTAYTEDNTTLGAYDIASNTWSTVPNPMATTDPGGEGTGDITATGGLLYVAEDNSFASFDPTTDTTTTLADIPSFTGDCSGEGISAWGGLQAFEGMIYVTQGDGCNGFAVYDIALNTWTLLPNVPGDTVLGSALDPVSGTFFAYGSYGGDSFFRYDIAANSWSTVTFPFDDIDDGGMAYVSTLGEQGVYAIEGQDNVGLTRYVTDSPPADLSLTSTASPASVAVGGQIKYTLHVADGGPNSAADVRVTDPLPSTVTFVSSSTSQGICVGTTLLTCNVGTVANGGSATITVAVTAAAIGTATNTATVTSSAIDPNTANNTASASATITAPTPPPAPPPTPTTPKLKLIVSPNHAVNGRHVCFKFNASSNGHGVSGATIKLASHHAHTSGSGKAQICASLKHGVYRAKATKNGFKSASATVKVKAKSSKKGAS